ncbi:uncharacterized protein B0H18DRAFT_1117587 [Fomitopsis serialis]|uniref:uncharacterized protein n=1 Tax=Fomitopsis serialis TaxID=139415 RepID=UPI002008194E|nr:uncharacterized protein B0H18DRAFT_1117587 [Neoantrodia serialis]KAH9929241.1 hypothetical protein B0H18DRAFT_1117587 [Neoantrodia serialis]
MSDCQITPQHSVLYNIDITYHIMQCLAPETESFSKVIPSPRENLGTLAQCARTCKSLAEPATALLWRSLPSLIPLLSILSGFHSIRVDGEEQHKAMIHISEPKLCWTISGNISDSDRERFMHYARFVWALSIGSDHIHRSVMTILVVNFGREFLPRLRSVNCHSTACAHVLLPFLTPSLTSLYWEDRNSNGDAKLAVFSEKIASQISTLAPFLEELNVPRCNNTSVFFSFGKFERLRSLDISGTPRVLGWTVLQAIGSLEYLTRVSIPSAVIGFQPGDHCRGFQALTDLTVAHRIQGTQLLRLITPPKLRRLNFRGGLSLTDFWTTKEIREGVEVCLSKCAGTFESFVIDEFEPRTVEPLLATAMCFFHMKNLRTFYCSRGMKTMSLTNDGLRAMGRAWPCLEELVVDWSTANRLDPDDHVPSLQGVIDLAHACPRLKRISLSFVRLVLAPREDPYPELVHGLEELSLSKAIVREPVNIARVIDRMFPRVKLDPEQLQPGEKISDLFRVLHLEKRARLAGES